MGAVARERGTGAASRGLAPRMRTCLLLTSLTLYACGQAAAPSGPLPSPGPPRPLPGCSAVLAADPDGDGLDELLCLSGGQLKREGGATIPVAGDFQMATRGDLDGDGRAELILATGAGRGDRSAPERIYVGDGAKMEIRLEEAAARAQITDLRVLDGKLWVARFADNFVVEGGWLEGSAFQRVLSSRMGMRQLPLAEGGVVVGRLYGDEPKAEGDLRLVDAGGDIHPLPSLRGVRSLARADLDGDGQQELLVGDGWHHAYGSQAVARVQLLRGADLQDARTIAVLDGSYTARELEVLSLPDGRPAILATGSTSVDLLVQDSLGWARIRVGTIEETANAVALTRADGLWIAASGRQGWEVHLGLGQ